jgi:hypothetical protein
MASTHTRTPQTCGVAPVAPQGRPSATIPAVTPRIIAVSPDRALGERIVQALEPIELAVELYATVGALGQHDLDAALYVIHFTEKRLALGASAHLARLSSQARVVVVLQESGLSSLVDLMRGHAQVIGIIAAEALDPHVLQSLARRVLTNEIFGLHQVISGEVESLVCSYADRRRCSAHISYYLAARGIARKHHARIEQCVDEMLMNALYDAPVHPDGTPVFAGVTVRERVRMRLATTVTIQYAYDGARFVVGVRDSFGSLTRHTVMRVLQKCLSAEDKIDRKAGGAGVGLYLMVNAASAVSFHVAQGVATEAICSFTLEAPGPSLEQFTFIEQTSDRGDALVKHALSPESLRPLPIRRAPSLRMIMALAALVAVTAVLALVLVRAGGEPSAPPAPAVLELETTPTGALVTLAGDRVGYTPLVIDRFAPHSNLDVTLHLEGYRAHTTRLQVPARGVRARHVETLTRSDDFALVQFVSEPSGARVVQLGEKVPDAARTYTPAEIFLRAGIEHEFMIVMPGYIPFVVQPFTPSRGSEVLVQRARLQRGATLHIDGQPGTKVSVRGVSYCQQLDVPADCTLLPGPYDVDVTWADQQQTARRVLLGENELSLLVDGRH